ncbi:MAG: ATP synthase F1 subunit gamma [Bacteroidales bacterium]
MENLKEIRTRIASIQSTKKITSAMKMVAAAKLKKVQDAVLNLRPYTNKLSDMLMEIAQNVGPEHIQSDYIRQPQDEDGKILLVVITSNKGLCGNFNSNIIKKTVDIVNNKYANENSKGNVFLYTIGKAGTDFFSKNSYNIYDSTADILDNAAYNTILPVMNRIMRAFVEKEFEIVEIVYNKFKNAAVQILTEEKFLPIELNIEEERELDSNLYIFEPNKEYIVKELIPKKLRIQFYEAILESIAAENGARMTAMHKATDNAQDLIKELRLKYNKARQSAITKEISEVVGGAEALRH